MTAPTDAGRRRGAGSPAEGPSPFRLLVPLGLAVVAVVVLEAALGPVGFGAPAAPC